MTETPEPYLISDPPGDEPRVNLARLEWLGLELLIALGEDPLREGLLDTPRRFAHAWRDFIEYDPGNVDTTFEAVTVDQLIVVSGIQAWTMCEHHLLPFAVDITIGLLAHGHVLGLSKYARVALQVAHRLQLQERLTCQIADAITHLTESPDVGVIVHGRHLCAALRGVKQSKMVMHTSELRGAFRGDQSLRAEFMRLALIQGGQPHG